MLGCGSEFRNADAGRSGEPMKEVLMGRRWSRQRGVMSKADRAIVLLVYCCAFQIIPCLASDPCKPDRKFCGRLLLTITGAGETGESIFVGKEKMDYITYYTHLNFLQFSRNNPSDLPSYSIIIHSDPKLKWLIDNTPTKRVHNAGLLGVVPASRDSFQDFLANDEKTSLLQLAIKKFGSDKGCQALMKSEGLASVLPLLKVEMIVFTENSGQKIPLWSDKSESGTRDDWYKKDKQQYMDKDLIDQLRTKLGDSVVQTFVASCNGAKIGKLFQTTDQCSCFFSTTDSHTLYYAPSTNAPFGAKVSSKDGISPISIKEDFKTAPNVASMTPGLLTDLFKYYQSTPLDEIGSDPIFASTDRINPLQSFAFNSGDAKAEEVLNYFDRDNIERGRVNKLLTAGFMENLPTPIQIPESEVRSDPDLANVLDITNRLRNSYGPILTDTKSGSGVDFKISMTAFGSCMRRKNPSPDSCGSIFKMVDIAAKGTSDGKQSRDDYNVVETFNVFLDDYYANDEPNLIAAYNGGKLTISQLFEKLNTSWRKFDSFRQKVTSYAFRYYNGELSAELKSAFDSMKINYQNAFYSAQQEFFPQLRKGVLEVRLARIEEAAKLLHLHKNDLKSANAADELHLLANNLACLTNYPVGPAFDKLKGGGLIPAQASQDSKKPTKQEGSSSR